MADRISMLGYVPDEELPCLYSSADVFLLPSRYEGFGLVLLEAMACGTPVVGTDVGGIPTVIDGCDYGRLVERDAEAVGDVVSLVLDSDLGVLSRRAREHAEQKEWRVVSEDIENMYTVLDKML